MLGIDDDDGDDDDGDDDDGDDDDDDDLGKVKARLNRNFFGIVKMQPGDRFGDGDRPARPGPTRPDPAHPNTAQTCCQTCLKRSNGGDFKHPRKIAQNAVIIFFFFLTHFQAATMSLAPLVYLN